MKIFSSCLMAVSLLFLTSIVLLGDVSAQGQSANNPDEELLKRLEESGAFDKAIERSILRLQKRQADARKQAEEEALARRQVLAKNARPVDAARDHVWGDIGAPVSIIEYSDYECPFCKRFYGVPEEVIKRVGGKANLVWRQFPLEFHNPMATREAEASECAAQQGGNDTFWKYSSEMMKRTRSGGQGLPVTAGDPLVALARELKLDAAKFSKCLESGETRKRVAEDMKDGQGAGVQATPGMVLRNAATGKSILIEGAISVAELESAVRELLPE